MINIETGEIKLDDYGVIFHVDLTLEQFHKSHTPPLKVSGGKEHKYSDDYLFNAKIDGLNAEFQIYFRYTKLTRLLFYKDDPQMSSEDLLRDHDVWLARVTKTLPPYEFSWGEIVSIIDPKGGAALVIVSFTKVFPEGMDYKVYYQDRREQMERLEKEMARSRSLAPGEFPPGFSPKKR
jgi:hypothetical protein